MNVLHGNDVVSDLRQFKDDGHIPVGAKAAQVAAVNGDGLGRTGDQVLGKVYDQGLDGGTIQCHVVGRLQSGVIAGFHRDLGVCRAGVGHYDLAVGVGTARVGCREADFISRSVI